MRLNATELEDIREALFLRIGALDEGMSHLADEGEED